MVMPQVSITTAEVKLITWLKNPGDSIKRGEPIVEVETDKATVEVESYVDGYLRTQKYPNGSTVPVEAIIAIITSTAGESIVEEQAAIVTEKIESKPQSSQPISTPLIIKSGRIDISPVARKMAESNNIDLTKLKGSGPGGRIVKEDVEAATQKGTKAGMPFPATVSGKIETSSSMRNAIAQRTALSKATIPHYYVSIEIDMQAATNLIEDLKKIASSRKLDSPTVTDLILWACGKTLPQFPYLHGSWTENGAVINPEINLGLVVGLEEGLMVPILHQADQKGLFALTDATRKLKQKARHGGLSSSELTGGTFTVSNLGMFGVSSFIAVINPPESAVLALGAIVKRPVVTEKDEIIVRPILNATLSVDHRVVDGIMAAKFLKALKEVLENPSLLLLEL
jgi:pyruvate dehydrogenase E2 component (dihydrolipoamide acetyltransferase)